MRKKGRSCDFLHIKERWHAGLSFRSLQVVNRIEEVTTVQLAALAAAPELDCAVGDGTESAERVVHEFALVAISLDQTVHDVELERAYVLLDSALGLVTVERDHAVYVVPHVGVMAAWRQAHECGGQ